MILDNADDADLFFHSHTSSSIEAQNATPLIDYLPRKLDSQRELIVTTRNRSLGEDLANGKTCVEIIPFSPQEARDLLLSKLREDLDLLDTSNVIKLLDVLGHIPLAITQAAAFMNRNRMSLHKYLASLEKDEQSLADYLSKDLQDHRREPGFPSSIFRTWKLSFDQLRDREPSTAEIFSLMAMLDRQQIPQSLMSEVLARDIDFTTAIGTLLGFSLISKGVDEESFAMHRLVQLSVHQWLEHEDRYVYYSRQALQLLTEQFPRGDYENWQLCEALLPHAQQVLKHDLILVEDKLQRALLLYNIASFDYKQGRYMSAHKAASEAYEINREHLGEAALETLRSLNMLALIIHDQGEHETAEEMYRRVLRGSEAMLGPEHRHTLTILNNLATVLEKQGKYEVAEEKYRRVLKAREAMLRPEHQDTLRSLHNLASVLKEQKKYKAAEEMYRRALSGMEAKLGLEHPDTLTTAYFLAVLFDQQQMYDDASVLYLRASAGFLKTLGHDHHLTQACSDNRASMINKMEMEDKAR